MNILILLTANVSIKKWYLTKVRDREIQIYKELTKLVKIIKYESFNNNAGL